MKKCISVLSYFLVMIGALNWGLWGFFQFDFVAWLFHSNTSMGSRTVYAIIGLAALWSLRCICKCLHACCCGASCSCGKGGQQGGPSSGGGCCGR